MELEGSSPLPNKFPNEAYHKPVQFS